MRTPIVFSADSLMWHCMWQGHTQCTALCTLHNTPCTVHSAQCTVHSTQCTVYSAQFTVHSLKCTVYCAQCTVYSAQFAVHPMACTVAQWLTPSGGHSQGITSIVQCIHHSVGTGGWRESKEENNTLYFEDTCSYIGIYICIVTTILLWRHFYWHLRCGDTCIDTFYCDDTSIDTCIVTTLLLSLVLWRHFYWHLYCYDGLTLLLWRQ